MNRLGTLRRNRLREWTRTHVVVQCGLAYHPRTIHTKSTESRLPSNGEVVNVACLDNGKKGDEIVLVVIVGEIRLGRIAGKHSIEM